MWSFMQWCFSKPEQVSKLVKLVSKFAERPVHSHWQTIHMIKLHYFPCWLFYFQLTTCMYIEHQSQMEPSFDSSSGSKKWWLICNTAYKNTTQPTANATWNAPCGNAETNCEAIYPVTVSVHSQVSGNSVRTLVLGCACCWCLEGPLRRTPAFSRTDSWYCNRS